MLKDRGFDHDGDLPGKLDEGEPRQGERVRSQSRADDICPETWPEAGISASSNHDVTVRRFGAGRAARVAAMRTADALRERGVAAAPLFKPSMGGWIVQIYPGGIRRRT